jgi:hypothetical protein
MVISTFSTYVIIRLVGHKVFKSPHIIIVITIQVWKIHFDELENKDFKNLKPQCNQ